MSQGRVPTCPDLEVAYLGDMLVQPVHELVEGSVDHPFGDQREPHARPPHRPTGCNVATPCYRRRAPSPSPRLVPSPTSTGGPRSTTPILGRPGLAPASSSTPTRLKVGVVGAGLIAQVMHLHYLRELSDRFEISVLCDIAPAECRGQRGAIRGPEVVHGLARAAARTDRRRPRPHRRQPRADGDRGRESGPARPRREADVLFHGGGPGHDRGRGRSRRHADGRLQQAL